MVGDGIVILPSEDKKEALRTLQIIYAFVIIYYLRVEELIEVAWFHHVNRSIAVNKTLTNQVHGNLHSTLACTFA
jgi:hypothetical protein